MRILAIDPGTTHSGVVVYNEETHSVDHAEGQVENIVLLQGLRGGTFYFMVGGWEKVVIEDMQGMGLPVGNETFKTAKRIGRFQEAWERRGEGFDVTLVGRGDEKIVLCGCKTYTSPKTGKRVGVKDPQIKAAVQSRFPATGGGNNPVVGTKGDPGSLRIMYGQNHAWMALAVALTYVEMQKGKK